ncbi:hypothetical protein CDL15_Pgr007946 [Punica granatum]|uniref:Uncharacterized protein n=1 Tax=Punica granatum TaxID=22663 RepID=A0A218XAC4_PUNGR|nr:hypothetical protein CDL15_Pgr007946 [Punica granatum]
MIHGAPGDFMASAAVQDLRTKKQHSDRFRVDTSFALDDFSTSGAVNCVPVLAIGAIIFGELEGSVTIAAGESLLIQIILSQGVLVDMVSDLHPIPLPSRRIEFSPGQGVLASSGILS